MENLLRPTLQPFLDATTPYDEARYVFLGAPLDATASHRSGSRFAPDAVRRASLYMETYSLRTDLDLSDISLADVGDLRGMDSLESSLERISEVAGLIRSSGKKPLILGGEHTVTLGALRALRPDLVVDFDAHMDLRDSLLGLSLSHGTFMRRAMEELGFKLALLGVRAISGEEMEYAEENEDRMVLVTAAEMLRGGAEGSCLAQSEAGAHSGSRRAGRRVGLGPAAGSSVEPPPRCLRPRVRRVRHAGQDVQGSHRRDARVADDQAPRAGGVPR